MNAPRQGLALFLARSDGSIHPSIRPSILPPLASHQLPLVVVASVALPPLVSVSLWAMDRSFRSSCPDAPI